MPKFETGCLFPSIMPADMSYLTATQSISFARAPNAEHHPPFKIMTDQSASDYLRIARYTPGGFDSFFLVVSRCY